MAIKISGDTVIYDDKTFQVAAGLSSQRPLSPETGMFRFNTEDVTFEGYDGSEWSAIGGAGGEDLLAQTLALLALSQ